MGQARRRGGDGIMAGYCSPGAVEAISDKQQVTSDQEQVIRVRVTREGRDVE
jgi:hypothetical protein